ncbi:AAA family ATPase [Mariniluteicoccus endophyticus]
MIDDWQVARPVRRVRARDDVTVGRLWPHTVPAVRQLLTEGLDLGQATVLVGDNGTGKSTIVEALAAAYGLNPEGGSAGAMHQTAATESPLADDLRVERGAGASKDGFFLRGETMHGYYTYLESIGSPGLHHMSHGESFLEIVETRCFARGGPRPGLHVFDEAESALSFGSSLRLLAMMIDLMAEPKAQLVVATHSPVLAALPGARILELDGDGFHETVWEDLSLVVDQRHFLRDPQAFLRHLR